MTGFVLKCDIQGIVHPKMKNVITHPQAVANLYEFLSSAEHKIRLERMLVTRYVYGTR